MLKIISWNLLANEFIDPSDYPAIPAEILYDRETRINRIIAFILTHVDTDLFLFQEVMPMEADKLKAALNQYQAFISLPLAWYGETIWQSSNMIFVKAGKWNMCNLSFGLVITCENMSIANIHLDDMDDNTRILQIRQLIAALSNTPTAIIGGDFNHEYDESSALYKCLHDAQFNSHNFHITYRDKINASSIDQIATRNLGLFNSYTVEPAEFISDHFPVIVQKKNNIFF